MKKFYKYAGLAIIAVMFLSSIVAVFLQKYYYFPQQQQQQTQLPTTTIINYDLTDTQKSILKQNGDTLMIYQSPQSCPDCASEKNLIESFVTNSPFTGQLLLEELSPSQGNSTLSISSNYGQDTITNITQDAITRDLCNLVVQSPAFCALQQVK